MTTIYSNKFDGVVIDDTDHNLDEDQIEGYIGWADRVLTDIIDEWREKNYSPPSPAAYPDEYELYCAEDDYEVEFEDSMENFWRELIGDMNRWPTLDKYLAEK